MAFQDLELVGSNPIASTMADNKEEAAFQWFREPGQNTAIRTIVLYHNWECERVMTASTKAFNSMRASLSAPLGPNLWFRRSDKTGKCRRPGALQCAQSAHCKFLGRACPAEITVGWSRSIWNSSGRRLASCLFQPGVVLYPQLSTISKVLALQSIVHPICPLAVQTYPYFLFNSFASRKSDSNTSPRKHKYASAGAAFYIVLHLSSLSEEKFGPQSGLSRKHK